jgi:F0F1-type ATP synthase assembly protein I
MIQTAGHTGAVGIEVALAIVVGYFGGQHLDARLDTTPWLTWFGFVAGVGAAIKALVRVTRQYKKTLASEDRPADSAEPPHDPPSHT